MTAWTLLHRRDDGTYVIELNGLPYHVTLDDPLYVEVAASAEGVELPPEPGPMVLPPAPPPPLTARQLRLWLLSRGITRAMVEAKLADLPEPVREAAEIEWEYSTEYLRDHPLIVQIGAAFGMSVEDIDAAWPEAAAL